MRLICPNCGAQYEVDAAAIPDDGREVQCASCGHSWVQFPAPAQADVDGDGGEESRFERRQRIRREREEAEDGARPDDGISDDGTPHDNDAFDEDPRHDTPTPDRPPVKQDVLDILRSEAEHEAEARRGGGSLRAQSDVPADDVTADEAPRAEFSSVRDPDRSEARDRAERERHHELLERERRLHITDGESATLDPDGTTQPEAFGAKGDSQPAPEAPEFDPAPRRPERPKAPSRASLLPDVDHLNATLRPAEERRVSAPDRRRRERARERSNGGFRGGFLLAILIALLLLALYVLAGQLSAAVPGASGLLGGYVEAVDNVRRSLDGAMRGLFDLVLG